MTAALDEACGRCSDPVEHGSLVVSERVKSGRPGRPRVVIDPAYLNEVSAFRGPTGLKDLFACSARSVRRRQVENGIARPGIPVYIQQVSPDGTETRTYQSQPSHSATSNLTDAELDGLIAAIVQMFPLFGRRMIFGRLKSQGHHVPIARIAASYVRVNGPPRPFGYREIQRDPYNVAGANALWHHDGQHGKIYHS